MSARRAVKIGTRRGLTARPIERHWRLEAPTGSRCSCRPQGQQAVGPVRKEQTANACPLSFTTTPSTGRAFHPHLRHRPPSSTAALPSTHTRLWPTTQRNHTRLRLLHPDAPQGTASITADTRPVGLFVVDGYDHDGPASTPHPFPGRSRCSPREPRAGRPQEDQANPARPH